MNSKKIIYDFGSNNGDDIPYYLLKGDVVVAVEANPVLASGIKNRFQKEISSGRLHVENCVLTADEHSGEVPFYIHKHKDGHVLSQFPRPNETEIANYEEVLLPSRSVLSILEQFGPPYYIKIDIEGYDAVILRELFAHDIYPPFISAESHSIEIFSLLHSSGRYPSFNLIDGDSVPRKYVNYPVKTENGVVQYSFPTHSAGPFGEDIADPWMTADNFFTLLALEGLGWKDIHASFVIPPTNTKVNFTKYARPFIVKKCIPKPLRPLFERLGLIK